MELLNAGVRIHGKNMVSYVASSLSHTVLSTRIEPGKFHCEMNVVMSDILML